MIQPFKPIFLLNVPLRIFSKLLALSLDPTVDKVVLKCQNRFIPGIYISNAVVALHGS
jgi:predicted site-specific integrase-resolvase